MNRHLTAAIALITVTASAFAANYDEAKVPKYKMTDPLVTVDGAKVTRSSQWPKRRAEIRAMFEQHVYGKTPKPKPVRFEVFEKGAKALNGKAIRRQVRAHFTGEADGPGMDILIYLPADAKGPAPVFLALNFNGNHTVNADPDIRMPRDKSKQKNSRGSRANGWSIDLILSRGYGVATIYYGDIEPDRKDGFAKSVRNLYPDRKSVV